MELGRFLVGDRWLICIVGVYIYPGNWVIAIPKEVKNMDTYESQKCIQSSRICDHPFSVHHTSSMIASTQAWILCLTFGIIPFLLPALWNGFAIVFFDTGGYLDRVMEMTIYPGRSFLYGLFLWVTSFGWWFFWGPITIQSFLCLWMIYLTLRCHNLPAGPLATAISCVGLSLLTGISWYTSQLMPDILVPMVILALWLLSFSWKSLRVHERVLLFITALLGLMSHNSCLALGIGLIFTLLLLRVIIYRKSRLISIGILPPVAAVLASLALIPMMNLAISGKTTYSTGGPLFLFGRFVQAGIAQQWLSDHCPVASMSLCDVQNRLPRTADEFLWSGNSPLRNLGGWTGNAANDELGQVVNESIKDYPDEVLLTSFQATFEQFIMVETGDGLDNYQDYTRLVFSKLSPHIAQSFKSANQQSNKISQKLFDTLNLVHIPVAYLSVLGLLVVVGWGLREKRPDFVGLALYVFIALLGNALICGALSSPFDRYQSRLVWLATLVVGMAGVSWWHKPLRQQC